MDSISLRALSDFLVDCCKEGDGKESASWIQGDLRVLLAQDCRGRFGRMEIWGAPKCQAPGPLHALADWKRVGEGGLWIGDGNDGTRLLWRPEVGHLRWTPRVTDSSSKHRRQVIQLLQALGILASTNDLALS